MRNRRPKRPEAPTDAAAAREQAVGLLARREHSRWELRRKLTDKGFDPAAAQEAVDGLAAEGLQSDERFVEGYVRSRVERGYGPLRIRAELSERGVADALIGDWLTGDRAYWRERAGEARYHRFGAEPPADRREWARQLRFLQGRGFAHDHIRDLFDELD